MFAEPNIKRTITFQSKNLPRPLVLLLAFDFTPSDVKPSSSKQEQYPVVWKILEFQKGDSESATVIYTSKLAFTKAETSPEDPDQDNTKKWQLKTPTVVQEIGSSQQTMLVEDKKQYKFTPPTNLPYKLTMAMNGTGSTGDPETSVGIAFGFYEDQDSKTPAQVLYFDGVPKSRLVSLDFKPVLTAYFVPKDYYVPLQILTLPIPSPLALQVDLRMLSEQTDYIVSATENDASITPKSTWK